MPSLKRVTLLCITALAMPLHAIADDKSDAALFDKVDAIFADYALDQHIPGLVYGIVADGRLVYVRGMGVQDLESHRPVTPDSLFRIASMSKAFTALTVLKLRDDGKLRLDALAESYVPELKNWKSPTEDAPRIRVRDLLNHTAGLVTDDPWGDRQTPLPEADFTQLLRTGVPFSHAPGVTMEYSNLGYAILGRIIGNVSGRPYADTISSMLMQPLGMSSTGYMADAAPRERRAQGYHWADNKWTQVQTMAHGAFGAMGGVQTSAVDYAKWMAYLLAAWPARDGADAGPVKRATVRELAHGSNFPALRQRFGHTGADSCRQASTYGMGLIAATDCELGLTLSHGGGYPGYGSHVLLLPDYGVGVFAFTNRSYSGSSAAVWDAAMVLSRGGYLKARSLTAGPELAAAYTAAGSIYQKGDVSVASGQLAMNFLLDRDAAGWRRDLEQLKAAVGDCDTSAPLNPSGPLAGGFTWRCARGRVSGSVLLAPTTPPTIQTLTLQPKPP
ncbi:CubicO group peptidase, beta-lactamase class C family [Duganella sp. CF402]|uniref:serine hydrolase domain-containing protein n=1 Tax=unclassified Duganella TaxID=2636909 RepID=UPI0008B108C7|nr:MULTISPECIES: serine hydrolase domain-containing protein [unclassified Duganella]RZT10342.1 CubicO group peptidase (beta-lactamase class C family) [Duganella sp. BK701]SEL17506.1 CubicO group peptidase, beta-lactamase class C family [Duganella sp. CF402]